MLYPEIIFEFIIVIIVIYISKSVTILKKDKQIRKFILKMTLLLLITGFSWIWFVPRHVGENGESSVCTFRFQVFLYDTHDYSGYGNMSDLFFNPIPNKYGRMVFYKKIGGYQEYFKLKSLEYKMEKP